MKTRAAEKKAVPGAQEISTALLEALRRAGPDGVKAAGLRLTGKSPAATARREALAGLVADGSAATLGKGTAARTFLAEHIPTEATVAARLLALGAFVPGVLETPPTLWKEAELRRKLPAHEQSLLGTALDHLQEARQIVPLRHGRNAFVAFAGPVRVWLEDDVADAAPAVDSPASVPVETAGDLDDAELFFAYSRVVRESGGFPDVKIAGLQRVAGKGPLAGRLVALWREGRATFSLGDWSLADETTRAAAVELDGEKYLLVRLDG